MDADCLGPFLPSLSCSAHTRRVTKACYGYKASVKAPKNRLPGQDSKPRGRGRACAAFGMRCKGTLGRMVDGALCNSYSGCGMEEKQKEEEARMRLLPGSSSCLPCFLYDGSLCPNDDRGEKEGKREGGREGEGRPPPPRCWSAEQGG